MYCFVYVSNGKVVYVSCDPYSDEYSAFMAVYRQAKDACESFDFDCVEVWFNSEFLVSMTF